ncbi:MAG TPA: hypothetical protein VHW96_17990 [Solirubrobacteraceae bacterium]|jgi:hypothetical protein|nr:hypothetical protein [Solirubrobacteraceae bacterium]
MHVLDEGQAGLVRSLCELVVPGCERVGAEVYIDALLARMPDDARAGVIACFEALSGCVDGGEEALRPHQFTAEFGAVRAFACEAFYSDFVAAGRDAAGAYDEIDFRFPMADRINKDWSYLGVES